MKNLLRNVYSWFEDDAAIRERTPDLPITHGPMVSLLAMLPEGVNSELVHSVATARDWNLMRTRSWISGVALFHRRPTGVVLIDARLLGTQREEALHTLLAICPSACLILLLPHMDEAFRQQFIRAGGYDVITEPLEEAELIWKVRKAWTYGTQFAANGIAKAAPLK